MALLVDHDDADREYAYTPEAVTVDFDGSFTAFGHDSGWTVASMRQDWEQIFAASMMARAKRRVRMSLVTLDESG